MKPPEDVRTTLRFSAEPEAERQPKPMRAGPRPAYLLVYQDEYGDTEIKIVGRDAYLWCADYRSERPSEALLRELYGGRRGQFAEQSFERWIDVHVNPRLDTPAYYDQRLQKAPKVHSSPTGSILKIMRWLEKPGNGHALAGEIIWINGKRVGL